MNTTANNLTNDLKAITGNIKSMFGNLQYILTQSVANLETDEQKKEAAAQMKKYNLNEKFAELQNKISEIDGSNNR